jgi:hypothetical protein
MADENEQGIGIKLDGSYGVGAMSELTIYTRTEDGGEKAETFTFPFALINMDALNAFNKMHLILGYKLVKVTAPSALKELGL